MMLKCSGLVGFIFLLIFALPVTASEMETISLEEAQEIAFENSITLYLAYLGQEEASLNLQQAKAAMIMQPSPTMLMQATAGFELAVKKYRMSKDNLALTVKTDFYNVLRLQNLLEIAREGLESARRNLDVTRKKFEAGTVTQLDVTKATRNLLSSEADLVQLEHNLELTQMKFRQTLGVPLDSTVLPETTAFEIEEVEFYLKEDLAFALANREEIIQLELAVAVAKKNVELADNDYTAPLTLELYRLNLLQMEAQLKQVKELLTLEIKQNYLAIKDAKERIPVLKKGIEETQELVRLTQLMFESDMVVASDLADTQIALQASQNDLINAIYDYNLAKARYSYAVARALQ